MPPDVDPSKERFDFIIKRFEDHFGNCNTKPIPTGKIGFDDVNKKYFIELKCVTCGNIFSRFTSDTNETLTVLLCHECIKNKVLMNTFSLMDYEYNINNLRAMIELDQSGSRLRYSKAYYIALPDDIKIGNFIFRRPDEPYGNELYFKKMSDAANLVIAADLIFPACKNWMTLFTNAARIIEMQ